MTHVEEEALSGFAYDYDEDDSAKTTEDDKAKMNQTMASDKPVNAEPEPETEPEPVTGTIGCSRGLFINDVTQVGGGGSHFCDTSCTGKGHSNCNFSLIFPYKFDKS